MHGTLARTLLTLWLVAGGTGCAAQTEKTEAAMDVVSTAVDDIVRLARAEAPRERFDNPLGVLRDAYVQLGIPTTSEKAPGTTTSATSAPPKKTRQTPPPARPSPAELDRRQGDLGHQQYPGPSRAQMRWREAMTQDLARLVAQLQATVVDYSGVQAAASELRKQLAQRPPPEAP